MAKIILCYLPIALGICAGLWFRHSKAARYASVLLICFPASLHATYLLTAHRLVMLGSNATPDAGTEYDLALKRIQVLSQGEIAPFVTIIAALSLLAILPLAQSKK
jgi:hypothetical protein